MATLAGPPPTVPISDELRTWLLASNEPGIRRLARRALGESAAAHEDVLDGPLVRRLLENQEKDGGFGGHPYRKWAGAHWRLVALVELGIPVGEPRALAAAERVLQWLTGRAHRANVPIIEGLARRCGSQEGNALAAAARLGMADDPRVQLLAESLVEWQWPDGGWNCDRRPGARRSSFNETLPPIWGLHEFASATGDRPSGDAARRGAELLLEHGLFKRLADGETINDEWLTPHWPPYWRYDVLQALVVLERMGLADDPRTGAARAALLRRRRKDGRWHASGRWRKPPGHPRGPAEAVDWDADGEADRIVTIRALTVLGAQAAQ